LFRDVLPLVGSLPTIIITLDGSGQGSVLKQGKTMFQCGS